MKNLKIGYLGWDNSPCDHRRFSKLAPLMGLNAEPYEPGRNYDVIVLTKYSDLSYWSRFPQGGSKLIFDFVDSFFEIESHEIMAKLRGLARFVTGKHRYLDLSYHNLLKRMMERSNAIVCSTPEQKENYLKLNSNVHDILDFNDEQICEIKNDYRVGRCLHFAWEGMGANAWAFQEIAPLLRRIHRQRPIALHLVTDFRYNPLGRSFPWQKEVKPYLQKILGDVPVYLYEWNSEILSAICTRCDIALLPIPRKPAIYWAKPENRLLMLWRMGLPVLASATPAYARCMEAANNQQACENLEDWEEKLTALVNSESLRKSSAEQGRLYAEEQVSEAVLCNKWLAALESALG